VINSPLDNSNDFLAGCAADVAALLHRCVQNAPNYGVSAAVFETALRGAVDKYLVDASCGRFPTTAEAQQFLQELQIADLFLAIACAEGNEFAWWDFDSGYRRYIERIAHHLASAENDAEEVIDHVYVELYGTRIVEGARQSKFATYTGRGTLKGWLRTIVWHAVIDMHRARRDEVPLDDWSESGGEAEDRPGFRAESGNSEREIFDRIAREKYAGASATAFDRAFGSLGDHERLLLLYYHVEELKLREIARLVENSDSPLRKWFQRQSKKRAATPESRVHESTVMRWLERTYQKVLTTFRLELETTNGFSASEIEVCMEIVGSDLGADEIRKQLSDISSAELSKGKAE
jgi:RNA polymerase sigma-70 factor